MRKRPDHAPTGVTRQSALIIALLVSLSAYAADDEHRADPTYMTGSEVRIDRAIDGDLVAAAGRIHIDQPVGADAVLGAGSIDVQAPIQEDLRAAGGIVTVADRVGGEVMVAAGRIVLARKAEVHGHAWLAASNVTISGRTLSSAKIYARDVLIDGDVYGPLDISANHIEIRSPAHVYGDLTYAAADELKIAGGAQVLGKVNRTKAAPQARASGANRPKLIRPYLLTALFAAGVLLHLLLPTFTEKSVTTLTRVPVKSLGLGAALFFSIPPVAVLLVITIIGIPVAIVLAIAHAVALLAGYLITGFYIAKRGGELLWHPFAANAWRFAFFAIALVLLMLATSIPYIGPLIMLLAIAAGLGAMVLQAFQRTGTRSIGSNLDAWPAA